MTLRSVTILGATGSIGQNTLNLIEQHSERFSVTALTAGNNVPMLAEAARKFRPQMVAIADESRYANLKEALAGTHIRVETGEDGLNEAASLASDLVVSAIVGAAGLTPTLAAIERGAIVALANKECLVTAGHLIIEAVRRCGATLIPVDSEHSALFQVFEAHAEKAVEAVTLTASGGPFRTLPREAFAAITPEQALKHPNWSMGAKITIDSATMMNKGLELIEAYHLFPLTPEQIRIVVHPESIIHGLVHYIDGSVLAQLGMPDMRTPIAYALGWPERMATPVRRLDLTEIAKLTFEAPDERRFPAMRIAREALAAGGNATAIMNAANEVAVQAFLDRRIGFTDIMRVVAQTLERASLSEAATLPDLLAVDASARMLARMICETKPQAIFATA